MDQRVRFGVTVTASTRRWGVATVVVMVGVTGWLTATATPEDRPFGIAITTVVVLGLLWFATARMWLDPAAGTFTRTQLGVIRKRFRYADTTAIQLEDNKGGGLALRTDAGEGWRHRLRLPLICGGPTGVGGANPASLRALVTIVETHVRPALHADVLPALRAQLAHLEAGGSYADSPLAARTSYSALSRAAGMQPPE